MSHETNERAFSLHPFNTFARLKALCLQALGDEVEKYEGGQMNEIKQIGDPIKEKCSPEERESAQLREKGTVVDGA